MAQPSLSIPDAMLTEIDDRRHATTNRSQYIREAIAVRLLLEDRDTFGELLTEARPKHVTPYTTAEA